MAKRITSPRPDHLTMRLFDPGMSTIHRAGLGGLACTLKALEREHQAGTIAKSRVPGSFVDGAPPWHVDETAVTLRFGKPENAGEFLKRLFAYAFQIRKKDGLIFLPGQYTSDPGAAVLADLQSGLTLTFLQHGKVRQLEKESTTASYDPDGSGVPAVVVNYRRCSGFKHQDGWEEFVDKDGIIAGPLRVDGPICPGTVVRHVAFTGDTAAEDPPERMLPLYFALVGCLGLPVNRGVAALIVPAVENLLDFQYDRPAMTPTRASDCQITNAADGGLQAQLRLRRNKARQLHITSAARKRVGADVPPGCFAMTFMPTPWASQQKSRVATINVPAGEAKILDVFERALVHLPSRIASRTVRETVGRGKSKSTIEHIESFRSDSVVRPLIAQNLALGRKWYCEFAGLMGKINPASGKPYRNQLPFERKGLNSMVSDPKMWDQEAESLVVQSIHEAIRQSLGRIRAETDGDAPKPPSPATKNRWERFRERLRLDLVGAKTEAQLRFALMNLFSRGGSNRVLRESWSKVLPTIRSDWHLARDLGLLALASYSGKGDGEPQPDLAASQD